MLHARADYDRIQDPAGLIGEAEPVFLIRAKDRLAPAVVRLYAEMASLIGAEEDICGSAWAQADRMLRWQEEHGSQVPDMPPRAGRLHARTCRETTTMAELIKPPPEGDAPKPVADIEINPFPVPVQVQVGNFTISLETRPGHVEPVGFVRIAVSGPHGLFVFFLDDNQATQVQGFLEKAALHAKLSVSGGTSLVVAQAEPEAPNRAQRRRLDRAHGGR